MHAVEIASGRVLARMEWPVGNQLFALEALPRGEAHGFPMRRAEDAGSSFLHDVFFRAHTHDPT